jgi:hypothetical protein
VFALLEKSLWSIRWYCDVFCVFPNRFFLLR